MKWIILLATFMSVAACKSTKYVPVETTETENDSIHASDSVNIQMEIDEKDSSNISEKTEKSDSTIIRDSSVIVVNEQGKVIKEERFHEKEVYRNKEYERKESEYRELKTKYKELQERYDALYHEKQKTRDVPYPVEKPLSRWQNFKLSVGGFAISGVMVLLIVGVVWMVYKLKK